ncbi:MAG: ATPase [Deltaproteobacteria bacterium]|nr:ATPase [Deltaproteobacteria bacterium]
MSDADGDTGLLEGLIQQNLLNEELLGQLGEHADRLPDLEQLRQLLRMELLAEDALLPMLSERYGLPLLAESTACLSPFPEADRCREVYAQTGIVLMGEEEARIGVLTVQADWLAMNRLELESGSPIQWRLTSHARLSWLVATMAHPQRPQNASAIEAAAPKLQSLLEEAVHHRSSDIHLESVPEGVQVRFRVDGILQPGPLLPKPLQPSLFSHIKLLAGMDIAIRRRPQDGHSTYHARSGREFDLRVSSMPGINGEKLVLRLLDQMPVQHRLEALGFLKQDMKVLEQASQTTHGLILMVGPTGSGKTTTLYAILNALNSRERHIFTIENPVEYQVSGITQVSVNPEQGLGFAEALRASLRQDPDVILVGEIRDEETAEVAVKAALTGHLVLSTLHSGDAVTAVQRLLNLGIASDLLADTLTLIVSQRLVRKLCLHEEESPDCPRCQGTGYAGRIPVYELLRVNRLGRDRIREGHTGRELVDPHEDLHFQTMEQTAQRLVQEQLTNWREVRPLLLAT